MRSEGEEPYFCASTDRLLLAETTVLPLSSIALWCRVASSDCPNYMHSLFLGEENVLLLTMQ